MVLYERLIQEKAGKMCKKRCHEGGRSLETAFALGERERAKRVYGEDVGVFLRLRKDFFWKQKKC